VGYYDFLKPSTWKLLIYRVKIIVLLKSHQYKSYSKSVFDGWLLLQPPIHLHLICPPISVHKTPLFTSLWEVHTFHLSRPLCIYNCSFMKYTSVNVWLNAWDLRAPFPYQSTDFVKNDEFFMFPLILPLYSKKSHGSIEIINS
jgi:hypothetical protein